MSYATSISMSVTAAARDDANRLMRALGRDAAPDPGQTFSVELGVTRDGSIAAYGAHTWDDDLAAILASGTLPDIDWRAFNLTLVRAAAALAAISRRAEINRTPRTNFDRKLSDDGLVERDR